MADVLYNLELVAEAAQVVGGALEATADQRARLLGEGLTAFGTFIENYLAGSEQGEAWARNGETIPLEDFTLYMGHFGDSALN